MFIIVFPDREEKPRLDFSTSLQTSCHGFLSRLQQHAASLKETTRTLQDDFAKLKAHTSMSSGPEQANDQAPGSESQTILMLNSPRPLQFSGQTETGFVP